MTISTTTSRISYSGNGVTTAFSFPYKFLADGDLVVILVDADGTETTQVLTTNYTVSGAGVGAGGTVTMLVAPSATQTLVIYRELDITQETDYITGDSFPAETHETALDRLTMIGQQLKDSISRTLRLSDGSPLTAQVLPIPVADSYIRWNSTATELINQAITADPSNDAAGIAYTPAGTGAVTTNVQSKLRESVSVTDFGAVGDGVTDDTAAIQAAIDSGVKSIYFPSGTYLISSRIKVDGSSGGLTDIRLHGDGKASILKLANNIQRENILDITSGSGYIIENLHLEHNESRGGYFSFHDPQDGVTANSLDEQVVSTVAIGGTTINISATTLTGTLTAGSQFKQGSDTTVYTVTNDIVAAGNTFTGVTFTPALVAEATAGNAIGIAHNHRYQTDGALSSGATQIDLDCGVLNTPPAAYPSTKLRVGESFQFMIGNGFGDWIVDPSHDTVYTVTEENTPSGTQYTNVKITPALTANVDDNTFITSITDANNRYSCGIYAGDASDTVIRNVSVNDAPWHGILIGTGPIESSEAGTGCDNVIVDGCAVTNFTGTAVATALATRVKAVNNHIDTMNANATGNGIFFDKGSHNSIANGNTIISPYNGLVTYNTEGVNFSDNTLVSCKNVGIHTGLTGRELVISGNTIKGEATTVSGMLIRKGENYGGYPYSAISVTGNMVTDCTDDGIDIRQATTIKTTSILDDNGWVAVTGNVCTLNGGHGIALADCDGIAVTGNVCAFNGLKGMIVDTCTNGAITGNVISNNGIDGANSGLGFSDSSGFAIHGNRIVDTGHGTSNQTTGIDFDANSTDNDLGINSVNGSTAFLGTNAPHRITKYLSKDFTIDFASCGANRAVNTSQSFPGAAIGDLVTVQTPSSGTGDFIFYGKVTASDTVQVSAYNPTGGAVDLVSATYHVIVTKIE